MRAPSFWWRDAGVAARLLAPVAAAYGAVAARRLRQSGHQAAVPVLCIGNPTVGGAGKTPTAIAVGRLLRAAGERPAFLSRGYGGRLSGPVRVDPKLHTAIEVGDEPLLLARTAPTVVAADRVAGAGAAAAAGASVIVMDDGFQNPSLTKDVAILVVDGRRGVGNGRVFPAGPLRAPLGPQLERAQALLVIGEIVGTETPSGALLMAARARKLPVFHGRLDADRDAVAALAGRKALAFTGIADPEKFFATLRLEGIDAPLRRSFPDHHRYTHGEASAIIADADRLGLLPLTTEKDLVRLAGGGAVATLAVRSWALPVSLVLDEPDDFREFVLGAARNRRL